MAGLLPRLGMLLEDIRKLTKRGQFRKERILFVDDTPAKLARSYGNLISIRPFEGDPHDREFELLECYLRSIGDVPNVRALEKRGWGGPRDDFYCNSAWSICVVCSNLMRRCVVCGSELPAS